MSGSSKLNDKDIVIADDIIATGGTMATAIKLARESGARKIFAVATHALLLQQAKYRIIKAGADEIISTDTVKSIYSKVKVAPSIAQLLSKK